MIGLFDWWSMPKKDWTQNRVLRIILSCKLCFANIASKWQNTLLSSSLRLSTISINLFMRTTQNKTGERQPSDWKDVSQRAVAFDLVGCLISNHPGWILTRPLSMELLR